MKASFIVSLLVMVCACASKENKPSNSETTDSVELAVKESTFTESVPQQPAKTPLDTILVSYPNGKNLYFLVLEYYDSLPDKPIKDFELRDAQSNEPAFRAVSERLALGDELDPINGRFDSLFVVPTYSISSQNPLTVDLDFLVNGGLSWVYLCDLTYPFYKEAAKLRFLRYTFQFVDNKWIVRSFLQFTPPKCSLSETDLLAQFNKIKSEEHLHTQIGGEFMKLSFICFLNTANPHYKIITKEFTEAFGDSNFPYNYYPYIIYLDKFIVNFTSQ